MDPLPEEPGFGTLYNASWMAEQIVEDDDGLLQELLTREEVVT